MTKAMGEGGKEPYSNTLLPHFFLSASARFSVQTKAMMTPPGRPPKPWTQKGITGGSIPFLLSPPLDTGGADPFEELGWYALLVGEAAAASSMREVHEGRDVNVTAWNLTASTNYAIQVVARNPASDCASKDGFNPDVPSRPIVVTTGPASLPSKVERPVLEKTTGGAFVFAMRWPKDYGGSPLVSFVFDILEPVLTPSNRVVATHSWEESILLAGLTLDTNYVLRVAAVNNVGQGLFSDSFQHRTLRTPSRPSIPLMKLVRVSGGAVYFNVVVEDQGGVSLSGQLVQYRIPPEVSWQDAWTRLGSSAIVGGLNQSTSVQVSMTASNIEGMSERSVVSLCSTTVASVPGSPKYFEVISVSGGSISFMWYQFDTGGSPLTGYTISFGTKSVSILPDNAKVSLYGLAASTAYTFTVRAVNIVGPSPDAIFHTSTAAMSPPSEVRHLRCTQKLRTALTFAWDAPVDMGGSALRAYALRLTAVSPGALGGFSEINHFSTGILVSGLSIGGTYALEIIAVSAFTRGKALVLVESTSVNGSIPAPPTGLDILSVPSDETVDINWLQDDGSDVLKARVCMCSLNSPTMSVPDPASFTCEEVPCAVRVCNHSLTTVLGKQYWVYAESFNDLGWSASSDPFHFIAAKPGVSEAPLVVCSSVEALLVTWVPPPHFGSNKLLRFQVFSAAELLHTTVGVDRTKLFYRHSGLSADNSYSYRIRGVFLSTDRKEFFGNFSDIGSGRTLVASAINTGFTSCNAVSQEVVLSVGSEVRGNFKWSISRPNENNNVVSGISLVLVVDSFQLECDHDAFSVSPWNPYTSSAGSPIWSGGCTRQPPFVFQNKSDILLSLSTDSTVFRSGLRVTFRASSTLLPDLEFSEPGLCPCVNVLRGQCSVSQSVCKCTPRQGFSGEDCSGYSLCPSYHPACTLPVSSVYEVSVFGDDESATGLRGEGGMVGKSFRTLKGALAAASTSLVTPMHRTFLILPGVYTGTSFVGANFSHLLGNGSTLDIISPRNNIPWDKSFPLGGHEVDHEVVFDCAGLGPAVFITTGNVHFQGLRFKNCVADQGAVVNVMGAGHVSFSNCQFLNNSAVGAGGVLAISGSATAVFNNSWFLNNSAVNGGGGAIFATDVSSVHLLGSSLIEWSRARVGGAVYLRDSTVVVADPVTVLFRNNWASERGGHIAVDGSQVFVSGVTLLKGYSRIGGSIAIWRAPGSATSHGQHFSLKRSILTHSHATLAGGGLSVEDERSVDMTEVNIVDCSAGSARATDEQFTDTMQPPEDTGSVISFGPEFANTGVGGGVYLQPGCSLLTSSLRTVLISHCTAFSAGGGISVSPLSSSAHRAGSPPNSTISGVSVSNCKAVLKGGGVYGESVQLNLRNVEVSGNQAFVGGGLSVYSVGSSLSFQAFTYIVSNTAMYAGGGLHVEDSLTVIFHHTTVYSDYMDDFRQNTGDGTAAARETIIKTGAHSSQISRNMAQVQGGNVAFSGSINTTSSFQLVRPVVIGGRSPHGAGLSVTRGMLQLWSAVVAQNQAVETGGGLAAENASVLCHGCCFNGNSAGIAGGGIHLDHGANLQGGQLLTIPGVPPSPPFFLEDTSTVAVRPRMFCSAVNNSAGNEGGGVWVSHSSVVSGLLLRSCSASKGGGLFVSDGGLNFLFNVRVEACSALLSGGGVAVSYAHTLIMTRIFIESCSVASREGQGGGISLQSSRVKHGAVTLVGNSAPRGGNLALQDSYYQGLRATIGLMVSTAIADTLMHEASSSEVVDPTDFSNITMNEYAKDKGLWPSVMGGAVYASGHSSLSRVILSKGRALQGGGIFLATGAHLAVAHAYIVGCSAQSSGGGLHTASHSTALLQQVVFMHCSADSGGGISAQDSVLVHEALHVVNNSATRGSGIRLVSSQLQATAAAQDVTSSVVSLAVGAGGSPVCSYTPPTITSHLCYNTGAQNGGAVFLEGLQNGITHFNISSNSAHEGGAVYLHGGSVDLREVIINSNFALTLVNDPGGISSGNGGAIYSAGVGVGGSCADNAETSEVISSKDSPVLRLDRCWVTNNRAVRGGGLLLERGTIAVVTYSMVEGNVASKVGGAVAMLSAAILELKGSCVQQNTATKYGGGMFVTDSSITMDRSAVLFNRARYGAGFSLLSSRAELRNASWLANNTADAWGGGVLLEAECYLLVKEGGGVWGNEASVGGGLHVNKESVVAAEDALLSNNRATESGGLVSVFDSYVGFLRCQIQQNFAVKEGGGVAASGLTTLLIRDCALDDNTAANGGGLALTGQAVCLLDTSSFQKNKASNGVCFISCQCLVCLPLMFLSPNTPSLSPRQFVCRWGWCVCGWQGYCCGHPLPIFGAYC